MSLVFGGIRQLGFVVRDIEKAMAHWSLVLGVGPWFYIAQQPPGAGEFRYFGKPSPYPNVSIALANSGALQLELIQQHDEAPSLYLDSLKQSGEGAQHIAYWTDHFDASVRRLLEAGYVEGHAGQRGGRGRFAYFVHADLPSGMVELSELSGGKGDFFKLIESAARTWDGTDRIRRVDATHSFSSFPR